MTDITTDQSTVHLADAPGIPGLVFRRLRDEADWAAQAALIRAASVADEDDFVPSPESVRIDTEHRDGFRLERDLLLAEVDGELVGRAEGAVVMRDGRPVHELDGTIHPAWRRRGIGRAMLHWNERRAHDLAVSDPRSGGSEAQLGSWVSATMTGAVALLESEGYLPHRYGFTMVRRGLDDVEPVPMIEGLEVRPVRPEEHHAIWAADDEAFHDHFEHRTQTEEDFTALFSQPDLDTSLWRVAWAGDEVAGSVQAWIWSDENEALGVRRGWLERISIRRPWRRRGLARALIAAALIGLRERGMTEAMLGVDAQNVTGALGLYESVGFEVKQRSTGYRKALEAVAREADGAERRD